MQRTILVSDDEAVAESLRKAASSLDVTVVSESPAKVVERTRKEKPDLVVLDVQQKNALETLSLLKTGRTTKDIPVVAVAKGEAAELREMALEVGADGYFPKPLGKDTLAKLLLFLSSRR